ncbi:hypothetical protein LTS15_008395 [Exophiala xenobiotica]|nr:hypothetical protein LTS15_008395 [Exophiala xenobiotica]
MNRENLLEGVLTDADGSGAPPADARFSWMDTPADEESRAWVNTIRGERETIPAVPSPRVPNPQVQNMAPQGNGPAGYTYQMQIPRGLQQQQQQEQDPRYTSAYPARQAPVQVPTTLAAQSPPPQEQYPLPQPPEPVKQPSSDNKAAVAIAPDANPLTPTTPRAPQRASTNMAIVPPPPDPSHFSIGIYTPSPQAAKGGSWQHSLCSCAEPSTCFTGLFCPCIVYGRTQYRLALRGERKDPTNMLGYTAVNGSCIAFAALCGVNGFLAAIQRSRIRKTYNMSTEAGNVPGDCVKGLCCCCCVVAQDEKEVRFREEQGRKPVASGNSQQGYVAPTGMTFNPPPR